MLQFNLFFHDLYFVEISIHVICLPENLFIAGSQVYYSNKIVCELLLEVRILAFSL